MNENPNPITSGSGTKLQAPYLMIHLPRLGLVKTHPILSAPLHQPPLELSPRHPPVRTVQMVPLPIIDFHDRQRPRVIHTLNEAHLPKLVNPRPVVVGPAQQWVRVHAAYADTAGAGLLREPQPRGPAPDDGRVVVGPELGFGSGVVELDVDGEGFGFGFGREIQEAVG